MSAHMMRIGIGLLMLAGSAALAPNEIPGDADLAALLETDRPYHAVSSELFAQFGWELPDKGSLVRALADAPRAAPSIRESSSRCPPSGWAIGRSGSKSVTGCTASTGTFRG